MVTVLVAVIPLILWWLGSDPTIDIASTSQKYDALARITAISAISLLAFNIILSARLGIFESLFLGLDRSYRAHRLIGGTVLILVLLHAMLITAKYANISLISGYEFLKPNTDIPLMLGKFTLGLMIMLIGVSLYIKVKHEWFIYIQRTLGALIFVGGYHALFVSGSDVRSNVLLFAYLGLLGFAAAGLYIYRSILHKSITRTYLYTVETIHSTQNVTRIWLKPDAKPMPFYSGQFGFFRFYSKAVSHEESHPFSFSSNSNDDRIRLSAKGIGDYTQALANIKVGDKARIEGPYGQFSYTKLRTTNQVWVAGGIGVTPFLSMAHSLSSAYQVTLYYCVNSAEHAVFLKELQILAQRKKGFKVVPIIRDDGQTITGELMVANEAEDYLLCAPPPMMHDLESQLKKLGIKSNEIHYEEFRLV